MNQASKVNRRRFRRILCDAPVRLAAGGKHWDSELVDISLKGALVRMPNSWMAGETGAYTLSILLNDQEEEISMQVRLAHQHADMIGLQCIAIDLDSISRLKRLVQLNLDNATLLERELNSLMHERDQATLA